MQIRNYRGIAARSLCGFIGIALVANSVRGGSGSNDVAAAGNKVRIEAIRKAGGPTTLADLNRWYATPPTNENAGPIYTAAFAAITVTNPALPSFVAQNRKAIELLHQAAARKSCRYAIDLTQGGFVPLPHLAKVKLSAELLQQNTLLEAAYGRMDPAAQSVAAGVSLARSLEQEPTIISQLVRLAAIDLTLTGLERALNRRAFSDAQSAQVLAALQAAEENNASAFERSLAGERCFAIAVFESPAQLQAMFLSAVEQKPSASDLLAGGVLESHRSSAKAKEDLAFYLDHMESLIAAAKSPFPGGFLTVRLWRTRLEAAPREYYLSRMLLPALATAVERSAAGAGELRVAQTALAIERYRLAHNYHLPNSLDELVPQYLKAVPTDPYDGAPLRYRRNAPAGYTVYSIGADRQDNGGTHRPAKVYAGMKYDLAFSVLR